MRRKKKGQGEFQYKSHNKIGQQLFVIYDFISSLMMPCISSRSNAISCCIVEPALYESPGRALQETRARHADRELRKDATKQKIKNKQFNIHVVDISGRVDEQLQGLSE